MTFGSLWYHSEVARSWQVTGTVTPRLFPLWQVARRVRVAVLITREGYSVGVLGTLTRLCNRTVSLATRKLSCRGLPQGSARAKPSRRLQTRVGASDTDMPRRQGRGLWAVTPCPAPGRLCQREVPRLRPRGHPPCRHRDYRVEGEE